MKKLYFQKEFIVFILCGGTSSIFNLLARAWLGQFVPYSVSIVLSYFVGMVIAFTLNKALVFRQDRSRECPIVLVFAKFALVNGFSMAQTLLISLAFREIVFPGMQMLFYPDGMAHFIGLASTAFTSFLGHKFFTFRDRH